MQLRFRRALSALMAVVLLTSAPALALGFIFGEDAQTPVASSIEDDGMLRVYLLSLGDPASLGMTLAGSYTVEGDRGFRFDRDTQIVLAVDGENILLSVGGLTIDMGPSMTLTRQAVTDGGENGIYIHESARDALFEGDLSVSVSDGGLRCILTIHIEDYLKGVVAYEMSDSFPLEALKAQAVAARTYAMGRKWVSAARDYDVVDTTQDQVYRGLEAEYTNVIAAVEATRGVVGTYNGGFAMCYYTASNGGQTALATDIWGGSGDYGYLAMVDDPYDLENPSSLVNSISFQADVSDNATLRGMLEEALAAMDLPYEDVELESVVSIEPVEPKFEGSYMYTQLRFTLSISAQLNGWYAQEGDDYAPLFENGSAFSEEMLASAYGLSLARRGQLALPFVYQDGRVTLPDPVTVDLSVYDQIKDGLSLGLNGGDYELVSATQEEDGSFTISMRRFGHGVGMSQRGAQWMAGEYGMTYTEILNFYYPGMTLEVIEWPEVELTALEELPESIGFARARPTPTPTPAPLPALEEGEYYAAVMLESRSSSLNVREEPSTSARIVSALGYGQRVIVSSDAGDGWVRIRTAEVEGYVRLEYLEAE
ncbi:MAG TPA: SpoIID/LytB domain-containing protein [Candidatus Pullichristensenella stercorigallinarum]|uniref:SpoIID/LytB domain-containing protein n=1 Tax=Candidatus Pullichristensenella stercorigallinarum TaxID=2840909 RepID=A0A9D1CYS9_9FIRM|nr:SpoIID/LytB domain-containing protein [Candidatus Pullichristensenella stercorigallinarum]